MSPLVELLNAWSADCTRLVWAVLWQSTLLACAIAAVCRCVPRTSPAVRHWLWQIVALKLLLMPFWTLAVPWPDWFSRPTSRPTVDATSTSLPVERDVLRLPPSETPLVEDVASDHAPVPASFGQHPETFGQISWRSWLLLGWLLIVAGQPGGPSTRP